MEYFINEQLKEKKISNSFGQGKMEPNTEKEKPNSAADAKKTSASFRTELYTQTTYRPRSVWRNNKSQAVRRQPNDCPRPGPVTVESSLRKGVDTTTEKRTPA